MNTYIHSRSLSYIHAEVRYSCIIHNRGGTYFFSMSSAGFMVTAVRDVD